MEKEVLHAYPFRFRKPGWTSSTETVHLAVGAMIVTGVGLSIYRPVYGWIYYLSREPLIFLSSALIFTAIFVIHELAHKAAAKYYGLWAEFRLNLIGALLTVISIAPTPLKFVSPGAVMIAGATNKKIVGVTALAGPFTSIVLAALAFLMYLLVPSDSFTQMLLDAAALGAWLALLNLVPYGILDGAKVFWWNRLVWAAGFATSVILGLAVLRFSFL